MFENNSSERTFYRAPQSATSVVAAFGEPAITVLSYLTIAAAFDVPIRRSDIALCLFVFAVTFPGRNRFWDGSGKAALDIVGAWLPLVGILLLFGYATRSLELFEQEVLAWWFVSTPALHWLLFRAGRHVLLRVAALPDNVRTAVVIGAGALGHKVAAAFEARANPGHRLLGYFDDRSNDRIDVRAQRHKLGNLHAAGAYVRRHGVHDVYITLPLGSQPRIVALFEALQDTTASIYFVPDVFGITIIQGRLEDMNGVPVVGLCETPFTGSNLLVKRLSDLVLASLLLLLILPVLAAIAIGIKLGSPGPVIFRQRRNGLDGEEIVVYKFRSMRTQDDGQVVKQATRGDPRITPFGAFLRRTSLDELPQLFNVLQGRMSIVGPRPHAVAHNAQYRQLIRAYMVRHKVKPGITGWAQVNGFRGETDTIEKMRGRVEHDLEYLRNWSLLLDLRIIVRTVRLVFFDRNAY